MCWSIAKSQLKENNSDENYVLTEKDIPFFFHVFLRKVYPIFTAYKEVIFAGEGRGSLEWRRSIYPDYKMNRAKRDDDPEYKLLKTLFPKVDALLNKFKCKVISVDGAEGDDVIYALTKYFTEQHEEVQVISSDGDFAQLLNFFEGVNVYTPLFKRSVTPKPNIIMEKAIIGDPSDGIPGIPRIGKKTLEKMLEDRTLWVKKMTPENEKIYESFVKIVDLSKAPEELHRNIIDKFNEKEYNEFNPDDIEAFFLDNNLRDCLMNWGRITSEIQLTLSNADKEVIDLSEYI